MIGEIGQTLPNPHTYHYRPVLVLVHGPDRGRRTADVDANTNTIGMGIGTIMEMGTSPQGGSDHDAMNLNHGNISRGRASH